LNGLIECYVAAIPFFWNTLAGDLGVFHGAFRRPYGCRKAVASIGGARTGRLPIMKEKVVFCWSGGKDSALALYKLMQEGRYEVVSLLTTCNEHFQRVSMHGVRLDLLERQAEAIGLPLQKMFGQPAEIERGIPPNLDTTSAGL